jgi:MFS family permease
MRLPSALTVLRNPRFRMYWVGQGISLTGTWMQVMAQGWVLTRLSSSAWVLGALNVVGTLPLMLLSVYAGHLADRHSKRRIMLMTQVALMLLAFVLAYLAFSERIALVHLFILAFGAGIAAAFDLPASQALPAEMVEPAEIPRVVALMQAVFHGSRLLGPAIAGLVMARFGEGSAFLANGISFIAVIVTLIAIGDVHRARGPSHHDSSGMGAGFRYLRGEPLARGLMVLTALTTMFVFPLLIVLMLYYVRHVLQSDERGLGLMMSVSGLGSLSGALALLFGRHESLKRWLAVGIAGIGFTMAGISLSRTLPLALPLVLVLSFCVSSLMGRIAQTIQHQVPNELRGRVMAVYGMTFFGVLPYAALGASALTDVIGFGPTLQWCTVLYVIASAIIVARLPRPVLPAPVPAAPSAAA